MDEMFSFASLIHNPNATIGDYFVIEWANPEIRNAHDSSTSENVTDELLRTYNEEDVVSVFTHQEYMMTSEGTIRTSK